MESPTKCGICGGRGGVMVVGYGANVWEPCRCSMPTESRINALKQAYHESERARAATELKEAAEREKHKQIKLRGWYLEETANEPWIAEFMGTLSEKQAEFNIPGHNPIFLCRAKLGEVCRYYWTYLSAVGIVNALTLGEALAKAELPVRTYDDDRGKQQQSHPSSYQE